MGRNIPFEPSIYMEYFVSAYAVNENSAVMVLASIKFADQPLP